MARTAHCVLFLVLIASPSFAQSSFYGGGSFAADAGSRGPIDLGTLPAAGGFIGWRFVDTWSVEFHLDKGFKKAPGPTFEGLLFAQSPFGSTPEERERYGIYGISTREHRAEEGFALLFAWRPQQTGRVGAAVLMGLSRRRFETRHITRITGVGPDVTYPPDHPLLQDTDETSDTVGGGLTGGFMIPVKVASGLAIAPEVRVTFGLITDESTYRNFYSGLRVMWGY